jgi:hypothetical protein
MIRILWKKQDCENLQPQEWLRWSIILAFVVKDIYVRDPFYKGTDNVLTLII